MRLLHLVLTAQIMTFGLVGAAVLVGTAAGAQEESTGQAFESREMTGPENTTQQTPTPERSTGDVQASTECPGAVVVGSTGPTDEGLIIGPFSITGEMFRLTYETTDADESGLPFFDITVLDEEGNEVGGQVIFEEGTVREVVRAGPGNFTIEARSEDLKYKITGEDCTGGGSGGGGRQAIPTDPIPEDQYKTDVDPPDEDDVIPDTVSDEPLPNTGGGPLLGLAVFGLICIFAAFALLRPVIRRDP